MFHVQEKSYNVVSTGFTIQGVVGTVYLADESIDRDKGEFSSLHTQREELLQ